MRSRAPTHTGCAALAALAAVALAGARTPPALADTCGRTPSALGPRSVPFGNARQQPSLAVARGRLSFAAVVPRSFGRPFRIWASAGERQFRSLGVVYRRTDRDWFQLNQSLAGSSRPTYDAVARDVARRDPCGLDARLARLDDGSLALVIVAPDRTVVNFRRGTLSFQVLGPAGALGRHEAVRLANVVLGAGR